MCSNCTGTGRLVSIRTDGKRTIRVASQVCRRALSRLQISLLRIWYGLHQLDLIAQTVYSLLANDTFVTTLTALIEYLRCQAESRCAEKDDVIQVRVYSLTVYEKGDILVSQAR